MISLIVLFLNFNIFAQSNLCAGNLTPRLGLEQLACSKELNINDSNKDNLYDASLSSLAGFDKKLFVSFSTLLKKIYYKRSFPGKEVKCDILKPEFTKNISACLKRTGQGGFASKLLGNILKDNPIENLKKRVIEDMMPYSSRDDKNCFNPTFFNEFKQKTYRGETRPSSLVNSVEYFLKNINKNENENKIKFNHATLGHSSFIFSRYPILQSKEVISYLRTLKQKNNNSFNKLTDSELLSKIINSDKFNNEISNKCKSLEEMFNKLFCRKFNFANLPVTDKPVKANEEIGELFSGVPDLPANVAKVHEPSNRVFLQCQTDKCQNKVPCEIDAGYDYNYLKDLEDKFSTDLMSHDVANDRDANKDNCSLLYCDNNVELLKERLRIGDIESKFTCKKSNPADLKKAHSRIAHYCSTHSSSLCNDLLKDDSNFNLLADYIVFEKKKKSKQLDSNRFTLGRIIGRDQFENRTIKYSYGGKKLTKRLKISSSLFNILGLGDKVTAKSIKADAGSGSSSKDPVGEHSSKIDVSSVREVSYDTSSGKSTGNAQSLTSSPKLPSAETKSLITPDSVQQAEYIPTVTSAATESRISTNQDKSTVGSKPAADTRTIDVRAKNSVRPVRETPVTTRDRASFQNPATTTGQKRDPVADDIARQEAFSRITREKQAIDSYNQYHDKGSVVPGVKNKGVDNPDLAGTSASSLKKDDISVNGQSGSGATGRSIASASNPDIASSGDQVFEVSKEEELATISISQIKEFTRVQVNKPFYLKLGSGNSAVLIEVEPASCGYRPKIKKLSRFYSYLLNNPSFSKCLK